MDLKKILNGYPQRSADNIIKIDSAIRCGII